MLDEIEELENDINPLFNKTTGACWDWLPGACVCPGAHLSVSLNCLR